MIKPEPIEELNLWLTLNGSIATAVISTTDGDARWKSSGMGSVQSDFAGAFIAEMEKTKRSNADTKNLFIFLPSYH
jgi:hypothetical protein